MGGVATEQLRCCVAPRRTGHREWRCSWGSARHDRPRTTPCVHYRRGGARHSRGLRVISPQTTTVSEPRGEFLHESVNLVIGHLLALQAPVMNDRGEMTDGSTPRLSADDLLQRRARYEGVDRVRSPWHLRRAPGSRAALSPAARCVRSRTPLAGSPPCARPIRFRTYPRRRGPPESTPCWGARDRQRGGPTRSGRRAAAELEREHFPWQQ